MNGKVVAIYITSDAGEPMQQVKEVEAIAGAGLKGDRYATGDGSFNKGLPGQRQVTFINGIFFEGSGFEYTDSRRNIVTMDVELMRLINKEFNVGTAKFRGVKYCKPCTRPNELGKDKLRNAKPFNEVFFDRGGIIADVIEDGVINEGDPVISPVKSNQSSLK